MSNDTDKNEPGRFLGEGVSFRAKLIGVLEVPEARGDRMCQEALSDLKMAIRAAGEHKQRIQVHVAIDGLRLRDDKTGDSLYHHPVHKISFIAQDMTDSRAFGYIFGSPDTGHRFFGIKTDKAASQVVIAMRDLFQVVFELKKKEIELAKQQLEGKSVTASLVSRHSVSATNEAKIKNITATPESSTSASKGGDAAAEGGVAELVDLEQELSSLRRGLTQVEGLTPSSDPFGDSFTVTSQGLQQKGLLPPPPSGSSSRGRNTPASSVPSKAVFSPNKASSGSLAFDLSSATNELEPPLQSSGRASSGHASSDHAASGQGPTLVDNVEPMVGQAVSSTSSISFDVFTELDPLGTGRSKPYVDKKLFFQELKNPPKRVLKDIAPTQSGTLLSDMSTDTKAEQYSATMTSLSRQSGGSVAIKTQSSYSSSYFTSDPFAETDPFDSTDPFSDSFKDDPFTSMAEFPRLSSLRVEDRRVRERGGADSASKEERGEGRKVFNGPLQVSLPPEPDVPRSPRLQRQSTTDSSTVRQRPQPSSKLNSDSASPPPPLPPKKCGEGGTRPPPRPPHEMSEEGPPLPPPSRKKEPQFQADRTTKPRLSSAATNSSEDEYLTPAPPPLPVGRRFDITLSQLLTCSMEQLSDRLRVPVSTLSSMTLPTLTAYLRSYLAADIDRAHIHIEPMPRPSEREKPPTESPIVAPQTKQNKKRKLKNDQFEDNFAPNNEPNGTFVANFDDFDKKANPSYDRYAAFREIQEQELKTQSILDTDDRKQNGDTDNRQDSDKEELTTLHDLVQANEQREKELRETSRSPLKTLDELTLDSFNKFRKSVSPNPSHIDSKIEDIKNVMKNLQFEQSRRSVSPCENETDAKQETKQEKNDRYAALREINITEPQDEFESLPPEVPKERKRSDEKSDGFDNSDFFDCIDNSSLSFSHVDDAFRKSPHIEDTFRKSPHIEDAFRKSPHIEDAFRKSPYIEDAFRKSPRSDDTFLKSPHVDDAFRKSPVVQVEKVKVEEKKVVMVPAMDSMRQLQPPPRLSAGSISDVASASSPEIKERPSGARLAPGEALARWSALAARGSPCSSDGDSSGAWRSRRTPPHPRRRPRGHSRQTSSSSRDVSPWDEEPPPPTRHHRPASHHRESSRHNSSGSRECLDSGSGRDKDKIRDRRESRDRDREIGSRDGTESVSTRERDRRDSGSGRDRRDISKERDIRDRRDRRSRDRDPDAWEREYGRERQYSARSRERSKDYREKDRDRHRMPPHSWDDEEDYSDGGGSGSSPRERWPEPRWRRDERNYGSLGWRESRRRAELRQTEDSNDRRYGSTLGWANRRTTSATSSTARREPDRRRPRREDARHARRDPRYDHAAAYGAPLPVPDHASPFDDDFAERKRQSDEFIEKKRQTYASLEGTRFAFEPEEVTASPLSVCSARARDGDSPATRFRFDSDSVSPRSMFEDDFTVSTPRARAASIAEEDEGEVPPLRNKPPAARKDIKKSESVNIFVRETDPFEGDDFFACTGSDRVAKRENWPGDFQAFDNV